MTMRICHVPITMNTKTDESVRFNAGPTWLELLAERDRLQEVNGELLAALNLTAAALAVVTNHVGVTHPVRGFAHEAFLYARAAIAKAKGDAA